MDKDTLVDEMSVDEVSVDEKSEDELSRNHLSQRSYTSQLASRPIVQVVIVMTND